MEASRRSIRTNLRRPCAYCTVHAVAPPMIKAKELSQIVWEVDVILRFGLQDLGLREPSSNGRLRRPTIQSRLISGSLSHTQPIVRIALRAPDSRKVALSASSLFTRVIIGQPCCRQLAPLLRCSHCDMLTDYSDQRRTKASHRPTSRRTT
jgi:hypothetical protein